MAIQEGLNNNPGENETKALLLLVQHTLNPLRIAFGNPIAVTSGYRAPEVNKQVGGVVHSQHIKGEAADCYTPLGAKRLLDCLLDHDIPFDQAILYKKKNFLHISYYQGFNRRQVIFN